jgi:DNA-binding beta-propeller fold protein YncE
MKIRLKHNSSVTVFVSLMLTILMGISGCSQPAGTIFPPDGRAIVWPQPPEVARIGYVGTISTEADLKPARSWDQGLRELFFGKDNIGVLIFPTAVTVEDDIMYVADGGAGAVHVFDFQSRQYRQVTSLDGDQTLTMPVAITLAEGNLYVADSVLKKICVFDNTGVFRFSFGGDLLMRPTGIAFSPVQQKLYVTDTAKHKIVVFDNKGNFLSQFGSRGVGPGQFNFPTHLCVDSDGKLYVSDTLNYRVQVFSSNGIFIRMFGAHGDRPGNFAHPAGIATDSQGHMYVVDKQYENVQIFDHKGNILMALGVEGSEPGEFWLPAGIFISHDDRIYIADSFNKRIQVFDYLKAGDNEQ